MPRNGHVVLGGGFSRRAAVVGSLQRTGAAGAGAAAAAAAAARPTWPACAPGSAGSRNHAGTNVTPGAATWQQTPAPGTWCTARSHLLSAHARTHAGRQAGRPPLHSAARHRRGRCC